MEPDRSRQLPARVRRVLRAPSPDFIRARDLYVHGYLKPDAPPGPELVDSRVYPSLEAIAAQLGISASTLHKRSMREGWTSLRTEAMETRQAQLEEERRQRDELARASRLERDQKLLDSMKDQEMAFRTNAFAVGAALMQQAFNKTRQGMDPSAGTLKTLGEAAVIGTKLADVALGGFDRKAPAPGPGLEVGRGITMTPGVPGGAPPSVALWTFMREAQARGSQVPDLPSPLPEPS